MAKKTHHYYVLVFTSEGPVYVTKTDNMKKVAYWEKDQTPKEVTKSDGEWLVIGLNLNGTSAQLVCSPFEIEMHPYNYEGYEVKIEKKGGKK